MKNFVASLTIFTLGCSAANAAVTIELDAGILRGTTATSLEPVGGLLQIIATRSGSATNFGTPTPGSFATGADNLVVANFAMNYTFGSGETDNRITFTLENTGASASATTFDVGDPLLLRWWPSITYNTATGAPSRTPTGGDTFGQFRSDTGENGGIAWFTPTDGSLLTFPSGLNFNTIAAGGTNAETAGFATNIVSPVPEPSTYALLGLGLGGLTFGAMQQRRRRQVAS